MRWRGFLWFFGFRDWNADFYAVEIEGDNCLVLREDLDGCMI